MTRGLWLVILLAVNLLSSLAVIATKQESRRLENELQKQRFAQDHYDTEWLQLQLEEAVWSSLGRIEQVAHDKLGMQTPPSYHLVTPHQGRP